MLNFLSKGLVNYDEVLKEACDDDGDGHLCVLDWANVNYANISGYVVGTLASDCVPLCVVCAICSFCYMHKSTRNKEN